MIRYEALKWFDLSVLFESLTHFGVICVLEFHAYVAPRKLRDLYLTGHRGNLKCKSFNFVSSFPLLKYLGLHLSLLFLFYHYSFLNNLMLNQNSIPLISK